MERYEVKASELHLAFDPEQPGLTTVYLASEVDARIAELESQLLAMKWCEDCKRDKSSPLCPVCDNDE